MTDTPFSKNTALSKTSPEALAYCRAFPGSVDARLHAALLLESGGDQAGALEEAAQACLLEEPGAVAYRVYGTLLLRSGDFARAEVLLAACLDLVPDDFDALVGLSSLLYRRGERAEARAVLEECITHHPFIAPPSGAGDKPGLLRVLGYADSAFHIVDASGGGYGSAVHGGHFSPDALIDAGAWNCTILNVLDQNTRALTLPPRTDIVLNTISDPDRERSTLLELALFLDRHPQVPVINPPQRVLQTTRERNAARLSSIPGLRIARTERLEWRNGDPLDAMAEVQGLGFRFPVILRKTGSQTGDDTTLASSPQDMHRYFARGNGAAHYAIQYHDMRRPDGLYQKTRVFFINGRMYPVAHLYHDGWSVHSGDRYSVMIGQDWTQQAERAFLDDPFGVLGPDACEVLSRVSEVVGLDYFGIDFTIDPDGHVFIFEANATMRHNFDHAHAFPYTRPTLQQISVAFQTMVQERCT